MELQYDGSGLHGWARQDGLPTVEGSLDAAFSTVLGISPRLRVAGRTDAGVHARRQVVSLLLPGGIDLRRLVRSLNALTPASVAIVRIARASEGFDARKDAISRTYRYYLTTARVVSPFWRRYCWQIPGDADTTLLGEAAAAAQGRHNFTAFTPAETEHVFFDRLVTRCVWKKARGASVGTLGAGDTADSGLLYMEIEAEAFLRHMVRTLVGTMVDVARGRLAPDDFARLLNGAPRDRAGVTAPAHGLFLWDVKYARR